jgi:tRNA 2-selenouridine synthase
MAISRIDVIRLQQLRKDLPVLDVRSPAEYAQAHIPGAHSLPLFSDEERKEIGTLYKQKGQKPAIKAGLNHFGKSMLPLVEEAEKIVSHHSNPEHEVLLHCWRGGMRSSAVAWLLDLYGFKVHLLVGGYKAYRKWALAQLALPFRLHVLGGYTGSGKTEVLAEMKKNGFAVVDLEGIAKHKGSAFGNLAGEKQPSQEMFDNLLAEALTEYYTLAEDGSLHQPKEIWIEDESSRIGDVNLVREFYHNMQQSPLYVLDIPFEERLKYILKHYSSFSQEKIVNAIIRIKKRLGGLEAKNAIHALLENDISSCFRILLGYYDKEYGRGMERKKPVAVISATTVDPVLNATLFQSQTSR